MIDIEKDYGSLIDKLCKLIKSSKTFDLAIEYTLKIHAITHTSEVSSSSMQTYCDDLLSGLKNEDFNIIPTEKNKPITYHLWHIARIEDLVGNLLIMKQSQIFNDDWMARMNVSVRDTGNAMDAVQIFDFCKRTNKQELINYRNAVGCQTRKILKSLTANDLKQKPESEYLLRLVSEGGLLENKNSIWLKDFWGRHTVAGLVLLPLTRHHMMHLPECMAIKQFIKSKVER
ncbi:MAG: DinB family protein [Defluviitaleaceae bacterium]|nr:DinB family protein [Defluviitaleaceae bacterium]